LDAAGDLRLQDLDLLERDRREPPVVRHVERPVRSAAHAVGRALDRADLDELPLPILPDLLVQEIDEGDAAARQGDGALGKPEAAGMYLGLPAHISVPSCD